MTPEAERCALVSEVAQLRTENSRLRSEVADLRRRLAERPTERLERKPGQEG